MEQKNVEKEYAVPFHEGLRSCFLSKKI